MNKTFSVQATIDSLKDNALIRHSNIPMGYVPGLPMLACKNGYLCLLVPYLRYKVTGKVDETLVYPIRHLVTITVPEGTIVSIEDLRLDSRFEGVDFGQPVGFFRHEAISHLDEAGYMAKKAELCQLYDRAIACLLQEQDFPMAEDVRLGQLINMLLEPSQKNAYGAICPDFHQKYIQS